MEFDYKNILIMGYGKSGQAVENIVKKLGEVSYKIYDRGKGSHRCRRGTVLPAYKRGYEDTC